MHNSTTIWFTELNFLPCISIMLGKFFKSNSFSRILSWLICICHSLKRLVENVPMMDVVLDKLSIIRAIIYMTEYTCCFPSLMKFSYEWVSSVLITGKDIFPWIRTSKCSSFYKECYLLFSHYSWRKFSLFVWKHSPLCCFQL